MPKKYVGIDIGTRSIKIAGVTAGKKSVILDAPVILDTPRFLVQNSRLANDEELYLLIAKTLKEYEFYSKDAVLILNDSMVITRNMDMPPVKPKELGQMLKLSISEYLPSDKNGYVIRHKLLMPSNLNPKATNYCMVTALKTDLAMDFYKVFKKADIKLMAIESTLNTMIKYFTMYLMGLYNDEWEKKTIGLLELGAFFIKFLIMQEGYPVFQCIINQNTQKIDLLIADALGLERVEAEYLKIKFGLSYLYDCTEDEYAAKVGTIIKGHLDFLLGDLYKRIQYFSENENAKVLEEIWLCGGVANMSGLDLYIQDTFDIKCNVVKPNIAIDFAQTKKTTNDIFHVFTNIVGAAIRGD